MTETDPPSGPTAPYAGSPVPSGAAPPPTQVGQIEVKERPFIVGLLLTIVTLGIYPFFWHYLTHDELARQMGRENKAKPFWFAYIGVAVVQLFLNLVTPDYDVGPEPTPAEVLEVLAEAGIWLAVGGLLTVASVVFFILYVVKQWELLKEAKERMGLQVRAGTGAFFALYYGSMVIALLLFWLILPLLAPLVMIPIAYYHLQENYNDIHRALRTGQVDPARYAPGGAGWSTGPMHAPAAGPTQVAPAYGQGYGQTSGGAAQRPQSYGQGTAGAWDAPTQYAGTEGETAGTRPPAREGFSVRERTQGEGTEPFAGSAPAPDTPLIEQSFQCPRCHSHVPARGHPGESVTIHCTRCQETGTVRLPET